MPTPERAAGLLATGAATGKFETAIGWQEKSIERATVEATVEQKPIADKLIALYYQQLPFDPKLLEAQPAAAPSEVADVVGAAPADKTAADTAPVNIP